MISQETHLEENEKETNPPLQYWLSNQKNKLATSSTIINNYKKTCKRGSLTWKYRRNCRQRLLKLYIRSFYEFYLTMHYSEWYKLKHNFMVGNGWLWNPHDSRVWKPMKNVILGNLDSSIHLPGECDNKHVLNFSALIFDF